MFTENKACSNNIFIITAVVHCAILLYNTPSQSPYFLYCQQINLMVMLLPSVLQCASSTQTGIFHISTCKSLFMVCYICCFHPVSNFRKFFQQTYFLLSEVISLTPNPQPGGPGYPSMSGSFLTVWY